MDGRIAAYAKGTVDHAVKYLARGSAVLDTVPYNAAETLALKAAHAEIGLVGSTPWEVLRSNLFASHMSMSRLSRVNSILPQGQAYLPAAITDALHAANRDVVRALAVIDHGTASKMQLEGAISRASRALGETQAAMRALPDTWPVGRVTTSVDTLVRPMAERGGSRAVASELTSVYDETVAGLRARPDDAPSFSGAVEREYRAAVEQLETTRVARGGSINDLALGGGVSARVPN